MSKALTTIDSIQLELVNGGFWGKALTALATWAGSGITKKDLYCKEAGAAIGSFTGSPAAGFMADAQCGLNPDTFNALDWTKQYLELQKQLPQQQVQQPPAQ